MSQPRLPEQPTSPSNPTPPDRWVLAPDTGFVERGGLTYLAALPDGPIVVLDAVASVILQIALDLPSDGGISVEEPVQGLRRQRGHADEDTHDVRHAKPRCACRIAPRCGVPHASVSSAP